MSTRFWISILIFSFGMLILFMPDTGPRLFSLSESHGPSFVDVIGLLLMIGSWTYLYVTALLKWRIVLIALGRPFAALALAAAMAGLAVTAASIGMDGPYWWMGALTAFVGQLAWIVVAFKN